MRHWIKHWRASLRNFWLTCCVAEIVQVYHQDSPGIRVFVRRNGWQRLIRSRTFSGVSERHLSLAEAFPELIGTSELLTASQKCVEQFNAWLEFEKRFVL